MFSLTGADLPVHFLNLPLATHRPVVPNGFPRSLGALLLNDGHAPLPVEDQNLAAHNNGGLLVQVWVLERDNKIPQHF